MTNRAPDIDTIADLLVEVGRTLILPRFGHLDPADVERKQTPTDPDDVVTVVDREAEERLTRALQAMAPGTTVIGEEAVHASPGILERLGSDDPLWLLDPIDGTKNFIAGNDGFGTMLSYVTEGTARAAWIFLPARNELYVAEAGSGAFVNGARLTVPGGDSARPPRGTLHTRYMPPDLRAFVRGWSTSQYSREHDARSAAIEYMDILRGSRDFAVYYRLLPWDHTGPGLILAEGGGRSEHLSGAPYSPRSADQVTIVASASAVADVVRAWFASGRSVA
jgi:fructose-1,6-bisphosphatase/inositol monophosphatase family enzyme